MESEIDKLKALYQKLDHQQAAGEDVVAELKKEINNLELTYLKDKVFPQVAQFLGSKIRDLRCEIDSSFQFGGERTINYSFCTSGSMLFIKDTIDIKSLLAFPESISPKIEITPLPTENQVNVERSISGLIIRLVDYSEKAVALYGDTKDFSKELKDLGGYFNFHLRDGAGWIFSKKRIPDLKKLFGSNLKQEYYNPEPSSNASSLSQTKTINYNSSSEDQWINMLLSMRGTQVNSLTSPHKAIYILAIIESIKLGYIRGERIFATTTLSNTFMRLWNKYVPTNWPFHGNAFQPYIHMSSEPFYFLVKAKGITQFNLNQNWSRGLVVRYIDYAYFDDELFKLLHNRAFTDRLSKALIDKFITQQAKSQGEKNTKTLTTRNKNALAGYKNYLSTLISNIGKPYSQSSINLYTSTLRNKYMQTKVYKLAGMPDLESISNLSIIDKLVNEVKEDVEHGLVNNVTYIAIKFYRDYIKLRN